MGYSFFRSHASALDLATTPPLDIELMNEPKTSNLHLLVRLIPLSLRAFSFAIYSIDSMRSVSCVCCVYILPDTFD